VKKSEVFHSLLCGTSDIGRWKGELEGMTERNETAPMTIAAGAAYAARLTSSEIWAVAS
jgi:hypothetical protein